MFDSWFIPVAFLAILIFALLRGGTLLWLKRRAVLRSPDPTALKRALENPAHALKTGVPVCGQPDKWIRSDGTCAFAVLDRTHVAELEDELRARNPAAYQGVEITSMVYGGLSKISTRPIFYVFLSCSGGACVQEMPIMHVSPLTDRLAKIYAARAASKRF